MKKSWLRKHLGGALAVLLFLAALWSLAGCSQETNPSPCSYDPAMVRSVKLRDYNSPEYRTTESRREIQTIVDLLNGFTYTSSQEMEDTPYKPRYSLTLYTDDWTYRCHFDENVLYFYHEDSVVQYTGEEGCLQQLVDLTREEWHTLFSIDPEDVSCLGVTGAGFMVEDREIVEEVVSALNSFTYREVTTCEPEETGPFLNMGLLGPEGGSAQALGFSMGSYYVRLEQGDEFVYYLGEEDHFLEVQKLLKNAPAPTKAPASARNSSSSPAS